MAFLPHFSGVKRRFCLSRSLHPLNKELEECCILVFYLQEELQGMQFTIQQIIPETADSVSFILEQEGLGPVDYKAGQFLTFLFETAFGEKRRSYSMSSAPALNEPLTITIKKVQNGEFSRKLVEQYRVGDSLKAAAISGRFILPENPGSVEQYFFLAAGSGITPCFSLIKTLLYTSSAQVVLIYSNKHVSDAIFYDSIKKLELEFPERFQVRFLFSTIRDIYNSRLSKWLLPQLLNQYLKTNRHSCLFYVCGPFEYMQMVELTLRNEDILPESIRKENFNTLPRTTKPKPPDTDPHQVLLHIEESTHSLLVQYPQTILTAAKIAGINIPYSCEAGRCGSCVARCKTGTVWMAYNEVLLDEELESGLFLTCQAYPVGGNVEIEI